MSVKPLVEGLDYLYLVPKDDFHLPHIDILVDNVAGILRIHKKFA